MNTRHGNGNRGRRLANCLAILVAGAVPVNAVELTQFKTVANTDYVSAGIGGMREVGRGSIQLTGVTGTVTEAWLYWHTLGSIQTFSPVTQGRMTVNGTMVIGDRTGPIVNGMVATGLSGPNCWDFLPYNLYYSQGFRADVTGQVTGDGSYSLQSLMAPGVVVDGASLIVFFDDGNPDNNRNIVLYDGNDSNSGFFDMDGWNLFMQPINLAAGDTVNLELHVADGQSRYQDAPLVLNGVSLDDGPWIFEGSAPFDPAFDALFHPDLPGDGTSKFEGSLRDIATFDITDLLDPGKNNLALTSARLDDCLSLVVALLDLGPNSESIAVRQGANTPPQPTPPMSVSQSSTSPEGNTIELIATVDDPDGDLLTVIWKVDGKGVKTESADTAGGPQTVTLTHLFTPGNHEVRILASDFASAPTEVSMTVTVELDTNPPTMDCLGDSEIIAAGEIVYAPDAAPSMGIADDKTPFEELTIAQTPLPGSILAAGEHWITVTAEDLAGNVGTCEFLYTVIDLLPPVVECSVNITELWPPNKRMVDVGFEFTAEGADETDFVVYSNEGDISHKGHRFSPDAVVLQMDNDLLALRAERLGNPKRHGRNGRVYLIVVRGSNVMGTSECVSTVVVPHDQSRRSRNAVWDEADAAVGFFMANGMPPAGYVVVGDGPIRRPNLKCNLLQLARKLKNARCDTSRATTKLGRDDEDDGDRDRDADRKFDRKKNRERDDDDRDDEEDDDGRTARLDRRNRDCEDRDD